MAKFTSVFLKSGLSLTVAAMFIGFAAACASPAPEPVDTAESSTPVSSTATSRPAPAPTSTPQPTAAVKSVPPTETPAATAAPAPATVEIETPTPTVAPVTNPPPNPTASPTPTRSAAPTPTPVPRRVFVSISGENLENLLTLHLELTYDAGLMAPTGAKLGSGLADALLEFNVDSPGRLTLGLIDPRGLSRDGVLIQVEFEVSATVGESSPNIEKIEAFGGENLIDLPVSARNGSFNADQDVVSPPVAIFGR